MMIKILHILARQKTVFNYGWSWACPPLIIYTATRELQKQCGEWSLPIKLWALVPLVFGVIWVISSILIKLGAMRAEYDMAADNSSWVQEFRGKIGAIQSQTETEKNTKT